MACPSGRRSTRRNASTTAARRRVPPGHGSGTPASLSHKLS